MTASARPSFRGLTLVETIVVVSILAVVGGALVSVITYFYRTNAYVLEQTGAVDSAQRGLERTTRALREASYGEDGSYPVSAAATSSITFYSDYDVDHSVEKMRIYLLSGTLYQVVTNAAGNPPSYAGQAAATTTIAAWVKNATSTPIFRYFDATGAELTGSIDAADVAYIRTRIDVDVNPLRAPNILMFEGGTTLRNLR